jgi:hypothetical protein
VDAEAGNTSGSASDADITHAAIVTPWYLSPLANTARVKASEHR